MGVKTTITELMLQLRQFHRAEIRWSDEPGDDPWEVTIDPGYLKNPDIGRTYRSRYLNLALSAALKRAEQLAKVSSHDIELERLQAVTQAETDAKALVTEAKAERKLEQFGAFCRFSEHVVGRQMWGE